MTFSPENAITKGSSAGRKDNCCREQKEANSGTRTTQGKSTAQLQGIDLNGLPAQASKPGKWQFVINLELVSLVGSMGQCATTPSNENAYPTPTVIAEKEIEVSTSSHVVLV